VLVGASAFDPANPPGGHAGSEYVRWCARGRPPVDRLLLAVAGQFHEVDEASALERLDDLARPAFGLESGRGQPALLAAAYLEVARGAGLSPSLLSAGPDWFVGFEDEDELVLVAPSSFDGPVRRLDLRRRCAHQLADHVLAELGDQFRRLGRREQAARSLALRKAMPVIRSPNS
jgi:hypothetical protein